MLYHKQQHRHVYRIKNKLFFSDLRENETKDLFFLDTFQEGATLTDYETYITRNRFINKQFYKSFLNEISASIYNEELSKHTAAFVHLYRAYENMSYAFPMIYASKTDNYVRTFESLRNWLSNSSSDGNVGELKFHRNFINTLFQNSPEVSNTIDIFITTKDEFREIIFDGLTKKALTWTDPSKFTRTTARPDKISIKFLDFHSFIINLRNRFFHYSNARNDNIAMDDIVDADLLFSLINKSALNYIATIFHGIVAHNIGTQSVQTAIE